MGAWHTSGYDQKVCHFGSSIEALFENWVDVTWLRYQKKSCFPVRCSLLLISNCMYVLSARTQKPLLQFQQPDTLSSLEQEMIYPRSVTPHTYLADCIISFPKFSIIQNDYFPWEGQTVAESLGKVNCHNYLKHIFTSRLVPITGH